MDKKYNALFTPWKINNLEIKNRIVMTSMGGTNLLGWMEINHFDKAGAELIMQVAKNNVGLILPGCQPIYTVCRLPKGQATQLHQGGEGRAGK